MTALQAASLAMAFLGFGLSLFLGYVLFPQRRIAPAGWASWLLVIAYGVWHLLRFGEEFTRTALHRQPDELWRTAAYLALATGLTCAAWLMRLAAVLRKPGYFTALGVGLILSALALPLPLMTIAPPFLIGWFYCFHHTFGLNIGRRSLFALALGVSTALYLLLIRTLAGFVETRWGTTAWVVEAALLLFAGILWFPIYTALSRFLARSARVYAEFGQTTIDEASLILDLGKRMQFLAGEMASRFGVARVAVVFDGRVEPGAGFPEHILEELVVFAGQYTGTAYAGYREAESPVRRVLRSEGYEYLIPLRDEGGVHGMLLVDPRPVALLGDNEELLTALAPQVLQSLRSCRLLEEKIRLEKDLLRQENLAGIGRMAASIAHEIKNPLSAIKTIAQLMKEDEAVSSNYEKDLGFILSEVDRLDKAVRQLLGTSNPAPSLNEEVDASALVESMVAALQKQAAAVRVTLEPMVAPEVMLPHSNRELVQQIVMNLVLNAIQASPTGSIVSVTLDPSGRLTVRDQGPGIPAEMRARVFEPYVTTKATGSGLGLAIVRRNARLLGGDVEIACPEAGGTIVTARLR
ncbi:MAG: ATP-binding protein [Bryobacteraceae bacterium]